MRFFWVFIYITIGQNAQLSERMLFLWNSLFFARSPSQKWHHREVNSLRTLCCDIYTNSHYPCLCYIQAYKQPFFWYVQWWEWDFPCMRFSQRAMKDFFIYFFFSQSPFFLAVILKKDMPTYTCISIDIFLLWIRNFHQAVEGKQRRGELFRISDHYGIKEDWGEFKGRLKGTRCKTLSIES